MVTLSAALVRRTQGFIGKIIVMGSLMLLLLQFLCEYSEFAGS